ncbi:aminopeptidase P family protein [Pannonibacter tanglangensis]|uniref:M24 family metallopeptidase n=1 Tax=Pannonibacter tanglangensis TaxID=2750084 RepID=A0ABW9ZLC5_9HYPH|nr:aminopeptidase P family protein [Pannonibacter sp. XCT-34]NBN63842.1 M24 family metallopeptidase [Pannonibacter sp. XCT-34]
MNAFDLPAVAARLAALRREMARDGLEALVVPRFDAHQGEYIAPHDERLAYLTGFTGSAGVAIVTHDRTALFVDGRYTVQAERQCGGHGIERLHLHTEPPEHWLADVASPGWRVGYDAMLLPPAWLTRYEAALTPVAVRMVVTEGNLVDRIWTRQPAPPQGRISAFPLQFAGRSTLEKRDWLRADMARIGASHHVETQPDNIAWFLNVRGDDVRFNPMPQSFLLVARDGRADWFVDRDKFEAGLADGLPGWVRVHPMPAFLPHLRDSLTAADRVAVDPDFSPAAVTLLIRDLGAEVIPRLSALTLEKAVKNRTELEGLRDCHVADGAAWVEFGAWLARMVPERARAADPLSELEAEAAILEFRRRQPGFLSESFRSISAAAGNAAMCHYAADPASQGHIMPDQTYLLDSGGQYLTGTTDATRSYAFGPVSPQYRRAYTAVFRAFHALATARFPKGTQGHHLDAICRRPLWDLGLDYDHGTGHGIGHRLSVHEQPQRIGRPFNPIDLQPGMVLSIEPGHYVAGDYGIRIENLFEIREAEDGFLEFHTLTLAPIQTDMLDAAGLSQAETDWLDTYHARVRSTLQDRVSPAAASWLQQSCAALGAALGTAPGTPPAG